MQSKTNPPTLERAATKRPKQTRRTVVRWIKRGVLGAGVAVIVILVVRALLPETVVVDTAAVARGPLEVEVREDGQTRVRDRFVVTAPITGELARIELEAGAVVERGAAIAQINPPRPVLLDSRTRSETVARLAAARAHERAATTAIARARQSKEVAVVEAARTRRLEAEGVVPGVERERADLAEQLAIGELAAAEQQRLAAASEIAALQAVLDPSAKPAEPFPVTAPVSGRILRVLRESAGPVAAGTPLLELGDPAALEVVVDVLSRDAERIAPGMDVWVETAATAPLHGTVRLVEPSAFTRISALGIEEQRVNVIAKLAPAEIPANLGDAFRVDARIVIWHGDRVLVVPSSALFRERGRWAVYVIADGRAQVRQVEIGHRGRLNVEITHGLAVGDTVITHPSDRVVDGARVAARP